VLGLIILIVSVAALVAGFLAWPLYWIPLLALGYFPGVLAGQYQKIQFWMDRGKPHGAIITMFWFYLSCCVGIGIEYGLARAVGSFF
jgi:hypothetical protein